MKIKKIMIIFPKDSEAIFNSCSSRTFGGATVQMYLFAKELGSNSKFNVFSLICDYNEINFSDSEHFNFVKSHKENDNFFIKVIKIHRAISKIKPDVIIQHGLSNASCLMALYCRLRGIKFVYMFAHDLEVSKKFQSSGKKCYLFPLLIKNSHLLVVQNKLQYNSLLKNYNSYKLKIHLIYNGLPLKKRETIKKDVILWVARSDEWKNPELFIKIASMHPGNKFMMICPNSGDDHYYDQIIKQALCIDNLEFLKFVPFNEIDKYFEKAILFINTSDYEGYPQTFIQATMNSVPVFSLNVNPDDFITKNNCGQVFHGDLQEMSEAIGETINDSVKYKYFSDNAYKYYLENHNIKNNVEKLISYL